MGDIHFVLRFPIKNSRVEASYFRRALGSVTLLRAIIRFLKALNFSLSIHCCRMFCLVKNEAPDISFNSKRWPLP